MSKAVAAGIEGSCLFVLGVFSLGGLTMPGLVPLLAVHVFCLVWVIILLQGVLFAFTFSVVVV